MSLGVKISVSFISNLAVTFLPPLYEKIELELKMRRLLKDDPVNVYFVGGGSLIFKIPLVLNKGLAKHGKFVTHATVGSHPEVGKGAVHWAAQRTEIIDVMKKSFTDRSHYWFGNEFTQELHDGESIPRRLSLWIKRGDPIPCECYSEKYIIYGDSEFILHQFDKEPMKNSDGSLSVDGSTVIGKVTLKPRPGRKEETIFVSAELDHGLPVPKFTFDSKDGPSVFDHDVRFFAFSREEMVIRRGNVEDLSPCVALNEDESCMGSGSDVDEECESDESSNPGESSTAKTSATGKPSPKKAKK